MAGMQFRKRNLYFLGHPSGSELRTRNSHSMTLNVFLSSMVLVLWLAASVWASVGGGISGTVTDQSGAAFQIGRAHV